MIEGKKLGLVGLVVAGLGALVGGCSDYGNVVARNVAEYALMEGVAGAVRNEVEGPRGTVVNVNNPVVARSVGTKSGDPDIFCYRVIDMVSGRYKDQGINFDGWADRLTSLHQRYMIEFPNGYRIETDRNGKIETLIKWEP